MEKQEKSRFTGLDLICALAIFSVIAGEGALLRGRRTCMQDSVG